MTKSSIYQNILMFAAILVIIALLKASSKLIAPILFAFTLTVLIWPILAWLERKGVPRMLAITLVALTVVLGMITLIIVVANSLQQLSHNIPYYSAQLNVQPAIQYVSQYITLDINGSLARAGINFASGFVSSIFSVITFLFMLMLMITASDYVVKRYTDLSSHKFDFDVWSKNIQVQYRIQSMSNLINGLVTMILFMVLGIDYAVLWGVLAFLLSYIPNIGLIIASIPPIMLTLIMRGWPLALLAVIIITFVNLLMDNIVTPRFMGKEFRIPAIYIFISFLICSYIFGILGAFLSLPLFLALRQYLMLNPKTMLLGKLLGADK